MQKLTHFLLQDPFSAEYLEELGKREGSLPPEYLKLLEVNKMNNITRLQL